MTSQNHIPSASKSVNHSPIAKALQHAYYQGLDKKGYSLHEEAEDIKKIETVFATRTTQAIQAIDALKKTHWASSPPRNRADEMCKQVDDHWNNTIDACIAALKKEME